MSKFRKRFSQGEKLEILNFYKQHGIAKSKRRYDVSHSIIYKWEALVEEFGPEGLKNRPSKSKESTELIELRRQNQALKNILADKELELRIKDAMLKKSL